MRISDLLKENLAHDFNELKKFGIVIQHISMGAHHISLDTIDPDDVTVFTNEADFNRYVGATLNDIHEQTGQDKVDITKMHSDPKVQAEIARKLAAHKPKNRTEMSWEELKQDELWDYLTENCTFIRNF